MDLCECMLFKDPDRADVATRHIARAAQHRQQPTRIRTARMANGELDEQARAELAARLRSTVHIDLVQIFRRRTLRKELTHHGTRKGFRVIGREQARNELFLVLGHRFRQERIGEQTLHVAGRDLFRRRGRGPVCGDFCKAQQTLGLFALAHRHDDRRDPFGTRAASPARTVQQRFLVHRKIGMDHKFQPRKVDPAGGNVRRDTHTRTAVAHHLQGARTLVLRQLTRQRHNREPTVEEAGGQMRDHRAG